MTVRSAMTPPPQQDTQLRKGRLVTDAPTRMFHWLFALSYGGAYITAESEHWRLLHVCLGYGFAALLAWRLAYGLLGPRQVRLGVLWRKLGNTRRWWTSVRAEPLLWATHVRQGRLLAMAWSLTLMLGLVIPIVLSGHGAYNEWGGRIGEEVLEELHEFLANGFLVLVVVHVGLIIAGSLLGGQNLARPMISGRLPGEGPCPVPHNHAAAAGLLLLAWLGLIVWLMRTSS